MFVPGESRGRGGGGGEEEEQEEEQEEQEQLTVFVQELVLDVLAEELLHGVEELLLLLQEVRVVLGVVPLGDGWEHTHTHTHTPELRGRRS